MSAATSGPSKAVDSTKDADPGLLYDLLGDSVAVNECSGKAQHRIVITADERDKGILIARAQAHEQLQILIGRWFAAEGPADTGAVD